MFLSLRYAFCLIGLSLIAASCGVLAQSPTLAPTPAPTQAPATAAPPPATSIPATSPAEAPTVEPSLTVEPSPAVEPTATIPPTPDPNLNVTDVVLYEDHFDGQSGWYWTFSDDVASFEAKDGQLNVQTKQSNGSWRFANRTDVKTSDQQLRVTAKVAQCDEDDEYGLMFRGVEEATGINSYVFMLKCNGAARVERLQNTDIFVLVDWTTSPAIVSGAPAENTFMVWMLKNQFHFYLNDQFLFSLTDATLAEGFYGFYIRDVTEGTMSLAFVEMAAKEVKAP